MLRFARRRARSALGPRLSFFLSTAGVILGIHACGGRTDLALLGAASSGTASASSGTGTTGATGTSSGGASGVAGSFAGQSSGGAGGTTGQSSGLSGADAGPPGTGPSSGATSAINGAATGTAGASGMGGGSTDSGLLPSNTLQVVASDDHACALLVDGTVRCWGADNMGQLGDGLTRSGAAGPVQVKIQDVAALSAGYGFTCALHLDGTIACWGSDKNDIVLSSMTMAGSYTAVPLENILVSQATKLAAGGVNVCVVLPAGGVTCWGDDALYDPRGAGGAAFGAEPISGVAVDVAVGLHFACAILTNGSVECWGTNASALPGYTGGSGFMTMIPDILNAVSLSAGDDFVCVTRESGTVSCWGDGMNGQLGSGAFDSAQAPGATVLGLSAPTALSAGGDHACAIASGSVSCWGGNQHGQLGNETTINTSVPGAVDWPTTPPPITTVAAGQHFTCAGSSATNGAYCWGYDAQGMLGSGSLDSNSPQRVLW